jgi:hypothetical protein
MEPELGTTETKYRALEEFPKKDLQAMADKLGLKLPPSMGVQKMAQAIRVRQTRLALDAEAEAKAQRRAESLDVARKPTFEEILMFGGEFLGKHYDASPRFIYRFINELDKGQEVSFTKGGVFIRIFEKDKNDKPLMCVMPEALCEKVPEPKRGATKLDQMEYELRRAVSLAEIGVPIYADRPDPQTGRFKSTIVGQKPRFSFIRIGSAPKDAPLGLYLDEGDENDTKCTTN